MQRSRPRVRSSEKKRERKARTQDNKDLWIANKRYADKVKKLVAKIKDIGLSDDVLKYVKKLQNAADEGNIYGSLMTDQVS